MDYLLVKRLSANAIVPSYTSAGAPGILLRSAYTKLIPRNSNALLKTDLAFTFPAGTYGRIVPEPSLSFPYDVHAIPKIINTDDTDNILINVKNNSSIDYKVERFDFIAQLICEKFARPEVLVVQQLPNYIPPIERLRSIGYDIEVRNNRSDHESEPESEI